MLSSDLQPSAIKRYMQSNIAEKFTWACYEQVGSTNNIVLNLTHLAHYQYYVCIADSQFKGRGRRARQWYSPKGDNIYCSVGFVVNHDDQKLVFANLIGTIALLQSIHSMTNHYNIQVKWPNDIIWQRQKLGGVLIETKRINPQHKLCVIGFGLNVNMRQAGTNINQSWTSLLQISHYHYERNQLIAQLLHSLDQFWMMDYQVLSETLYRYWQQYDGIYEQAVKLKTAFGIVQGRALGIDRIGRLLIKQHGQPLSAFSEGEVKLIK
jgi:BirA family biotin operon repressor/biotin-[acetyl-CoA-carboxylase] ligase